MKNNYYTSVRLPRRKASLFLVLYLQLVACSLWGQAMQKKALTVEDYAKWGKLNLQELSENGKWVSYNMSYENGYDTLFVKNTESMKTHSFPLGKEGRFVHPDWFIFQTDRQIHLLNLKSEKEEIIENAVHYEYSAPTKRVLILLNKKNETNQLLIRKLDELKGEYISAIEQFSLDPSSQKVLYTTKSNLQHSIVLLELTASKQKKTILHSGQGSYHNLAWDVKGKSLAFLQSSLLSSTPKILFYYDVNHGKIYQMDTENQRGFWGDSLTISTIGNKLKISDDSQRVFFSVQRKKKETQTLNKNSDVQIWNGNAELIYPVEEIRKLSEKPYLAVWHPFKKYSERVSSDTLPQYMLNGDQKYAVLSNRKRYEPQYDYEGPRDFYLYELATGKIGLFLKKHSGSSFHTTVSPTGKYIAYFKEKNWWIYNIAKQTHTNITKKINQPFYHNEKNHPNKSFIYNTIFWTTGDKEILLCDRYDIWAISADGLISQRLTRGREIATQFRFASFSSVLPSKPNYEGIIFNSIDLNKELLLEASTEEGFSGYYKWSPKVTKKLVFSDSTKLHQLIHAQTCNKIVYVEQRYDISPRLMYKKLSDNASTTLVISNPQQKKYYWGKTKLVQYTNAKGDSLKGILYYPAEYDVRKKYPMIVYIYEKLSNNYFNYIKPTQFEDRGFNISAYTSQGYFVLLPDIVYTIGEPGLSALDCVVSATKEIIKNEQVLPNKIGLIGHSFGGYETNFIVTQTTLFAAAVAGSAASDLTSLYMTIGATGRPDIWRFEHHQLRMGKSLFEDRESYDKNSPMVHAKSITTPLLTWTGNDDKQVDRNQSLLFYVALHRLKKKHIMLLYPREAHTITDRKNQKDLSMRIHDWFDYHLKDIPTPKWIESGLGDF